MRHRKTLALAILFLPVAGCSLMGTWKTVSIEPLDAVEKIHFSTVTFGKDQMYTGTAKYEGREITSTGRYQFNGMTLSVQPDEGEERQYDATLWWGRELILKHDDDGQTITAKMQRQ